jgi:hypothetical protein
MLLLDGYGHQDTMIGARSHRDVFPHVLAFLDEFAAVAEPRRKLRRPVTVL